MKRLLNLCMLLCACGSPMSDPDAGATVDSGEPQPELIDIVGAPDVLEDTNPDPNIVEVELAAQNRTISLGGSMSYEMMTYNGTVPGPLLQAAVGDEVIVHFRNELDEPTTIHWHGLRISDEMDGSPRIQDPVEPGGTFTYRFVVPEAGTFWYHPHVRTNEQLEKGLYGGIVVRDEHDPTYDAERLIVLDDILVGDSSTLPPFLASHSEPMHGRFGNVLLTNGEQSELVPMAPAQQGHVERWRVLNVANARTMELSVWNASVRVIGSDGGLIREPYEADTITLPVGSRVELEVTYDQPGAVTLQSQILVSDGMGGARLTGVPVYTVDVVAGDLTPRTIERTFPEAPAPRSATREETLTFNAINGPTGLEWQLNGQTHPEAPLFVFAEGEVVRMTLQNLAGPEHPFHLHGQWFEVVSGGGIRPGLYDTVLLPGNSEVEIIAYLDNPGRWLAHCHILAHAVLGMMGEFVVEPRP